MYMYMCMGMYMYIYMLVIHEMLYATKRLDYFCRCNYFVAMSWGLVLLFLEVDRTFLDTVLAKYWENNSREVIHNKK